MEFIAIIKNSFYDNAYAPVGEVKFKHYAFRRFEMTEEQLALRRPSWWYLNRIDHTSELLHCIPADDWLGDITARYQPSQIEGG